MIDNDERLKTIIPTASPETYAYYVCPEEKGWVIVRSQVIAWALVETYYESEEQPEDHPFNMKIEQSVRPVVLGELGRPDWMSSETGLLHVGGPDEKGLYEMAEFMESYSQLMMTEATQTITGVAVDRDSQ